MLNPDGVFLGNYRTAFCGLDLNRQVPPHSSTLYFSYHMSPLYLVYLSRILQPRSCGLALVASGTTKLQLVCHS